MLEVKISRSAHSDLAAIDEYGAEQFGGDAAAEYSRGFTGAFELLSRHPHTGQARPEFGKSVRCKVYRKHRIMYRVTGDTVFVQRVLHHSRDVARHMPK